MKPIQSMFEKLKARADLAGMGPLGVALGTLNHAIYEADSKGIRSPTLECIKVLMDNSQRMREALSLAGAIVIKHEAGAPIPAELVDSFKKAAVRARLHEVVPDTQYPEAVKEADSGPTN